MADDYTVKLWEDFPSIDTPLDEVGLIDLENRTMGYAKAIVEDLEATVATLPTDSAISEAQAASMFGVIEFYSHSGTSGGASALDRGSDQRVAQLLKTDVWNRTKGGAVASYHEVVPWSTGGNGGWAHVYRHTEEAVGKGSGGSPTYAFEPRRDAAVVWYGPNDTTILGPSESDQLPLWNAMRAIISRLRAARIYEENDASVIYGNTWSVVEGTVPNQAYEASNRRYKTNTAGAGWVQVATPADFPGGTVVLSFLCGQDGSGALFDLTVDGQGAGQIDTRNVNAKNYGTGANAKVSPVVKRITGLAPGAHTIRATISNMNIAAHFDCWWVEAADPPLIAVPGFWHTDENFSDGYFFDAILRPYRPDLQPDYVAGVGSASWSAHLDTADLRAEALAAEFDDRVFFVELDDVIDRQHEYFYHDSIHLNDWGHARIAERIASAFLARKRSMASHARGNAEGQFISREPLTPERNTIESQWAEAALTLKGRKQGDQVLPVLKLDGAGGVGGLDIGSGVDYALGYGQLVAAAADATFGGNTKAGDLLLRQIVTAKSIRLVVGSWDKIQLTNTEIQFAPEGQTSSERLRMYRAGSGYIGLGAAPNLLYSIAINLDGHLLLNSPSDIRFAKGGAFHARLSDVGLSLSNVDATAKISLPAATDAPGGIDFGGDIGLWRGAAGVLRLDRGVGAAGGLVFEIRSGAAANSLYVDLGRTAIEALIGLAGGTNQFASGSAAGDLVLRIFDASRQLWIGVGAEPNEICIQDNKLGFFNTVPVVKPALTGSRGGNAAVASIAAALAALGLATDSTTA